MTQIRRFNALMDLQGVVVRAQGVRLGQSNVLFSQHVIEVRDRRQRQSRCYLNHTNYCISGSAQNFV